MMGGLGPFVAVGGGQVVQGANWPPSAHTWGRQPSALFPRGRSGTWDEYSVGAPVPILNTDGTIYADGNGDYRIFYSASAVATPDIDATGMFKTRDFREVRRFGTAPVLPLGGVGDPDRGDAQMTSILRISGTCHGWYVGNATAPGGGSDAGTICYATSTDDGETWTKQGRVVNVGSGDDSGDIYDAKVILDGSTFYMVAIGYTGSTLGMMLYTAASVGGPWSRVSDNYVFRPGGADINYLGRFWKENDRYHVTYVKTTTPLETWYANSPDRTTWTERRKILAARTGKSWDSGNKYNAFPITLSGRKLILYTADAYNEGIGFVSVPTGITSSITTTQASYTAAQQLSFPFSAAPSEPATPTAWVGIFNTSDVYQSQFKWTDNTSSGSGTTGIASGTVTFTAGTMAAGNWRAKLMFENVPLASVDFTVT